MSRKINSWDLKLFWDDIFFVFYNIGFRLRYFLKGGRKGHGLLKNMELRDKHKGSRAFVVGNGPSIKRQNLKLLQNEVTFFVNRAFLHKDYELIKPTYHIFIDPKMATGEWPLTFLDDAAAKNPDVTFLLSGAWYNLPQFQEYKKKYKIYWLCQSLLIQPYFRGKIDLTAVGVGGAVVEQGLLAAIYMGVSDIFFLGVDGNGLCYELTQRDSHFYGTNPENKTKSFSALYKDLSMMSNSLRRWDMIGKYCSRIGVNLVNLTDGGIMDFTRRMKYQDVVKQSNSHR